VANIAEAELDSLLRRFDSVDDIPHSEMTAPIQRINQAARELLSGDVLR